MATTFDIPKQLPVFVPPCEKADHVPGVRLLKAVYGEAHCISQYLYYDHCPWVGWEGSELRAGIDVLLQTLTDREAQVLVNRYGLDGSKPMTLETVGQHLNVTQERVRQIEAKALRKLRHPGRSQWLQRFRYPFTDADRRAALARQELCDLLVDAYGMTLAQEFTMRITRSHLAAALKAAHAGSTKDFGRALVASCRVVTAIVPCPLCDEPCLPGTEWCLEHMAYGHRRASVAVVVCDGCSCRFIRRDSQLTQFVRYHGRTQHMVFCGMPCFRVHAKEAMKFRITSIKSAKESE